MLPAITSKTSQNDWFRNLSTATIKTIYPLVNFLKRQLIGTKIQSNQEAKVFSAKITRQINSALSLNVSIGISDARTCKFWSEDNLYLFPHWWSCEKTGYSVLVHFLNVSFVQIKLFDLFRNKCYSLMRFKTIHPRLDERSSVLAVNKARLLI